MSVRPAEDPPDDERPLRYLITLLHPGYVRNYEDVLRLLLERGHRIHLLLHQPAKQARDRVGERLSEEFTNLTMSRARKPEGSRWRNMRWGVRLLIDYSRYLHPRYRDAGALRDRVVDKTFGSRKDIGPVLSSLLIAYVWTLGHFRGARYSDFLLTVLLRIERALPTSKRIDEAVTSFAPDLVLSTPYVAVGSREPDYLRSAQRHGCRTGILVASWDNLTNKGLIKIVPDAVFVWNEAQRREAAELHRIPADRVVVTGAQRFDAWFAQKPKSTRQSFCTRAGLDPARPFVLYLCSSPFIAPDERSFVERLITSIRDGDSTINDAGILVRPHPQNVKQWLEADLSGFENVTIWPPAGEQPVDEASRASFYDSIHHSAAVVGINTSAQIEAGIIGRTVHTVLDPQFEHTQEGTLHFHHLLAENGGLLHVADSIESLTADLERAITGELDPAQTREFIKSFVRPHGLDRPASPIAADELERVARLPPPAPVTPTWVDLAIRAILTPLAVTSRAVSLQRIRTRAASATRRVLRRPEAPPRPGSAAPSHSRDSHRMIKHDIARLRRAGGATIIVGPWMYSPALEILYWIPFLRWATQTFDLPADRIVAVSRGGVRHWYEQFCGRYVDLFDVVDHTVLVEAQRRGLSLPKRDRTGALHDLVVQTVGGSIAGKTAVLGPQVLHDAFGRYWQGRVSMRDTERFLDFRTLRLPRDTALERRLPDRYVAVQLAFSKMFPETPDNLRRAQELVESTRRAVAGRGPRSAAGRHGHGRGGAPAGAQRPAPDRGS